MNNHTQEKALIADLKLGLPEAVDVWYKTYSTILHAFLSKKLSNPQDVEEICRETFLNCLRQLPLFQERCSLKTWMFQIASHEVADYYRRQYAKKIVKSIPLSHLLFIEPTQDMHGTCEYVMEVLTRMRADYKELLLLKYVDQITVKEIATRLKRTIKSVEADLFRARQEFKTLYATIEVHT